MLKMLCVGLGGRGYSDRRSARATGEFEIVGGVDVKEDLRKDFVEETGQPAFGSFSEALENVDADVALIATPDQYHAPFSIQAMEAGLDVICEKPMAESLEDGYRMHEVAEKYNRMLMIYNQLRWNPGHNHAQRLIQQGAVGKVRSIELDMYVFSNACMRGYRAELPQLMLQDLGIHHFDLIRFLTGEDAAGVYMRSWPSNEEDVDVPTTTSVYGIIKMTGPVTASYRSNIRAITGQTGYACHAVVTGSRGVLKTTGDKLTLQTHENYHADRPPEEIEPIPPEHNAMEAFAHSIRTRKPALTDSSDNIKSLEVLFAAIASAEKDKVVDC